jgi:predicted nucleic acid-binding protein
LLLRSIELNHPMHSQATGALNVLLESDDEVCLTTQNLFEFWNVCTRPLNRNGLGMTVAQTDAELNRLEGLFAILSDSPVLYPEWRRLVTKYSVMGVQVHDTRLVAAMLVHKITHILTFNTSDFKRFYEITVVHPSDIFPNK